MKQHLGWPQSPNYPATILFYSSWLKKFWRLFCHAQFQERCWFLVADLFNLKPCLLLVRIALRDLLCFCIYRIPLLPSSIWHHSVSGTDRIQKWVLSASVCMSMCMCWYAQKMNLQMWICSCEVLMLWLFAATKHLLYIKYALLPKAVWIYISCKTSLIKMDKMMLEGWPIFIYLICSPILYWCQASLWCMSSFTDTITAILVKQPAPSEWIQTPVQWHAGIPHSLAQLPLVERPKKVQRQGRIWVGQGADVRHIPAPLRHDPKFEKNAKPTRTDIGRGNQLEQCEGENTENVLPLITHCLTHFPFTEHKSTANHSTPTPGST